MAACYFRADDFCSVGYFSDSIPLEGDNSAMWEYISHDLDQNLTQMLFFFLQECV